MLHAEKVSSDELSEAVPAKVAAPTPTAESTNTRRLEKWVGMATYRKGTDHRRANDART